MPFATTPLATSGCWSSEEKLAIPAQFRAATERCNCKESRTIIRARTRPRPFTLREACRLVGILLLDHLIVTDSAYYSFKEAEGWDA